MENYIDLEKNKLQNLIEIEPNSMWTEKYQVRGVLGEGSYAIVYETVSQQNEKNAVKVAVGEKSDIQNEVRILTAMQHKEGFIKVKESGSNWFCMEKMGCSITQYLLSYPKLRVEVATRIGMLLLRKLKTLHQAGYLHLDIKPSNLVFTPDYSDIMLIDFGFATPIRHPTHDPSYFRGSIHYSSLNRMKGGQYSFIDDIESLLYVVYRMITGKLPWTIEPSQQQYIFQQVKEIKENISWAQTSFDNKFIHMIQEVRNKETCIYSYTYDVLRKLSRE